MRRRVQIYDQDLFIYLRVLTGPETKISRFFHEFFKEIGQN